jgi:hypothetical protein
LPVKSCSENNLTKYLLSPRWERIKVRGDRIWIFTPTLALPHQGGGGRSGTFKIFLARGYYKNYHLKRQGQFSKGTLSVPGISFVCRGIRAIAIKRKNMI